MRPASVAAAPHCARPPSRYTRSLHPRIDGSLVRCATAALPYEPDGHRRARAGSTAAADANRRSLVPAQSEIVFTSKQMGVPVEGRFKRFDARIVARSAPARNRRREAITIDTGSATSACRSPTANFPSPPGSTSGRFPQATFQSTASRRGRRSARGRGHAAHQGLRARLRDSRHADARRQQHHRHRSLQREAARLQDRRRRVVRHVDGRQRSPGHVQVRTDGAGAMRKSATGGGRPARGRADGGDER